MSIGRHNIDAWTQTVYIVPGWFAVTVLILLVLAAASIAYGVRN